jgi:3-oxoacyl-[acyl-carrier-protein] synthase III
VNSQLAFHNAKISGVVTTVGEVLVPFAVDAETLGLSDQEASRMQQTVGLAHRYIVGGKTTTSDLCEHSAKHLLAGTGVAATDIQGLIFVSQTPDYSAPASAISLATRLGLPLSCLAYDIRLGCSGFVYGLATAFSFVESGMNRILLCVGDVASKFVDPTDHSISPLMGDGGSAILIERASSRSFFQFYSDGTGERALIIPNSGVRSTSADNNLKSYMHMDGPSVFNFTLKRVPSMVKAILELASLDVEQIDFFLLHQPNKYILNSLRKRMAIPESKFPSGTQSIYGNLNSASIPATINEYCGTRFQSSSASTSLLAGFGIGLSWASAIIQTSAVFAPNVFIGISS